MYDRIEQSGVSDPKRVVQEGYDRVAKRHLEWIDTTRVEERAKYTDVLLSGLPAGARVLDLGCGAGEPTTRLLAERFDVTGVDISSAQIELAREKVPGAQFIAKDMTKLDFAPASFDGITAFYSLIHVPRNEQELLVRNMAIWLRPGGLLVVSMGVQPAEASYDDDFLGASMFWSGYDAESNRRMVESAGLQIVSALHETEPEFGHPVTFLWIVARKPA